MSGAHVFIDRSQFPELVRHELLESLRTRVINHKFHYESYKQAAKWLALHEAYSPARTDASCSRIYSEAFSAAVQKRDLSRAHVVGLGCGDGQKEVHLLELLRTRANEIACTMSDVSLPLVLTARTGALAAANRCHAVVCDLGTAENLAGILDANDSVLPRVVTMFGIVPNFEPAPLLSRIASVLRPDDLLLVSANLSAGENYAAGVKKVLPQYDNSLTRDWLMTLLFDLGFEPGDGVLTFAIETGARQLRRIAAYFQLDRAREICVSGELIPFRSGERIRVFFSYRHTPQTVCSLLSEHNIQIHGKWLNNSGEEGVFLCQKLSPSKTVVTLPD
jgi:uncharacterized SAM-dependent methyltransferase